MGSGAVFRVFGFQGLGFGVWGVRCKVWGVGVGFGVWGLGCGVWSVECGVWSVREDLAREDGGLLTHQRHLGALRCELGAQHHRVHPAPYDRHVKPAESARVRARV